MNKLKPRFHHDLSNIQSCSQSKHSIKKITLYALLLITMNMLICVNGKDIVDESMKIKTEQAQKDTKLYESKTNNRQQNKMKNQQLQKTNIPVNNGQTIIQDPSLGKIEVSNKKDTNDQKIYISPQYLKLGILQNDKKKNAASSKNLEKQQSQLKDLQQKMKQLKSKIIKDHPYKRIFTAQDYYKGIQQIANNVNKLKSKANYKSDQISSIQVINATNLSNGKQICRDGNSCQFYYYVIEPKIDRYSQQQENQPSSSNNINVPAKDKQSTSSDSKDIQTNQQNKKTNNNKKKQVKIKTVIFVSGLHGNQYIGPMSLYYSIHHLALQSTTKNTRIIIFPLANPSGFDRKRRQTFPTNIDPNRDYPIQQKQICYQASSTLIIDFLYRNNKIDLTVGLHNGQSQIGWNWGTVRQSKNSKSSQTQSQSIYRDIGQWLQYIGGSNKKMSMDKFKIGTMNDVIYPASSTFDDWAYAGSWYDKKIFQEQRKTKSTQTAQLPIQQISLKCQYRPYPETMHNGLVFLMQLGPFEVPESQFGSQHGLYLPPTSDSQKNGYISRTVRMITNVIKTVNPSLVIKFTNNQMVVKLEGCKFGKITYLRIFSQSQNNLAEDERNYIFRSSINQQKSFYMQGDLTNGNNNKDAGFQEQLSKLAVFKLNRNLYDSSQKPNATQQNAKQEGNTVKNTVDVQKQAKNLHKKPNTKQSLEAYKPLNLIIQYELICDEQWNGKGKTIFSQGRGFRRHEGLIVTQGDWQTVDQYDYHLNQRRTLFSSLQQAKKSFVQNSYFQPVDFYQQKLLDKFMGFYQQKKSTLWIFLFIIAICLVAIYAIYLIVKQIKHDMQLRKMRKIKVNLEQSHIAQQISQNKQKYNIQTDQQNFEENHQNSFQQQGPSASSSSFKKMSPTKYVEQSSHDSARYPQFCQSDKSMKAQQLNDGL